MRHPRNRGPELIAGVAMAAVVGGCVAYALRKSGPYRRQQQGSRPERLAYGARDEHAAQVSRTVTINKPRTDLYAFWRDFTNLAAFMENVESVRPIGGERAVWTIAGPAGESVEIETEVVDDRQPDFIAWRSTPNAKIRSEGHVAFRHAPPGRGTIVEATVRYEPPGGELGRLAAKLFQREPAIQVRRDLKRFKMLMETGEVATSQNQRSAA